MERTDEQDQLEAYHTDEDEGPIAWERRVFLVALVWSCLGTLLGGVLGAMIGALVALPAIGLSGLVLGGLVGAFAGGALEADHWGT